MNDGLMGAKRWFLGLKMDGIERDWLKLGGISLGMKFLGIFGQHNSRK